jgi:hypothetical protein
MDTKYLFPLTEITHFKNLDESYKDEVRFQLLNLPTHLPFPVDYRTQEEINETIRKNKEFDENRGS